MLIKPIGHFTLGPYTAVLDDVALYRIKPTYSNGGSQCGLPIPSPELANAPADTICVFNGAQGHP